MTSDKHSVRYLALWPLPPFLLALVCAVLGWPGTDDGTLAVITTLSFGVLYTAILVCVRVVRRDVTRRAVVVTSIACVVYHAVALVLPRPETGFIRVGVGDLMLVGGALVYGGVDSILKPIRRASLRPPARLQQAVTVEHDTARFRAILVARDAEGWLVYGRLQGGQGLSVWHVARLREPFALTSTALDSPPSSDSVLLSAGALHALESDAILTVEPGKDPLRVQLTEETIDWLGAGVSREAAFADGAWHVLSAGDGGSGALGRIGADGALEEVVKLPAENANANATAITRVGAVTWALTEHHEPQWVGHAIENGARDPVRSDALTARLAELASPLTLVGGQSRLWIVGYDMSARSTVAIAFPDGSAIPIGPGSVTGLLPDGDDLLASTLKSLAAVRPDGAHLVGNGWIPRGMLSVAGGVPSAAIKAPDHSLTLTTFVDGNPIPSLPGIRIEAEQ